jgi:hypothetical protein
MDLVNNYIYILEIPINIISKLRSLLIKNLNSITTQKKESANSHSLFFSCIIIKRSFQ